MRKALLIALAALALATPALAVDGNEPQAPRVPEDVGMSDENAPQAPRASDEARVSRSSQEIQAPAG